jgi:hypothetical protein
VPVLGALLMAGTLSGCSQTGPNSALQSARSACAVIEGAQFYPVVPQSGIYIGVAAGTAVVKAIERSGDPTLTAELPALKRAVGLLAGAYDGAIAAKQERLLQGLVSEPQDYCTTVGVPPAT